MDLIHEFTDTTVELSDEQLLARANQFVSALDDYKKITPFISFEYLSEIKPRDFYDWYNASPKDVKEEIAKMFNESPIDAVRTALAYAIHSKVAGKNLKVVDVDGHTVNMLYDNKAVTSQWVKEQGKLRVKTFSFFNPKTDAKSGIIKNFGGKSFVSFGVSRGFATDPNLMFNFSYGFKLHHFVNFELMFRHGTLPINIRTVENSVFTNQERVTGFEWFLGAQLPIRVGVTYFIPYVKPFWGMGLGKRDILFSYGVRSGLETGFRINNRRYLVLGVGYKMSRFSYIDCGGKNLLPTHSLDLYLKLYFSRK